MATKLHACFVCSATLVVLLGVCGCTNEELSLTVNGRTRTYLLHLPKTYTGDRPFPLVLALHQFSDTPEGMRRMTGFDEVAERENFIVAYPRGRWRMWRTTAEKNVDDVAFLNALLDELCKAYNIDQRRIYITGASAGAMMAQVFAAQSHRVAAVAAVMGPLERDLADRLEPRVPTPILFIHGAKDPVIPYDGGETFAGPGRPRAHFLSAEENAARWAQWNACEVTPSQEALNPKVTVFRYPCAKRAETVLYKVADGGHTWPGHNNWYPRFIVGPTSNALDATETIWSFFKAHAQ